MGHPAAQAYLASPVVVAASALKGTEWMRLRDRQSVVAQDTPGPLVVGFHRFGRPMVFAPQDNLNADEICLGKYTYQDGITLAEQAEVVMENYDPTFVVLVRRLLVCDTEGEEVQAVRRGVVLIAGYNFGTGIMRASDDYIEGSWRAGSDRGIGGATDGELAVDRGWTVTLGMEDGQVVVSGLDEGTKKRVHNVRTVGTSVQELWVCGGLEGYILKSIQANV